MYEDLQGGTIKGTLYKYGRFWYHITTSTHFMASWFTKDKLSPLQLQAFENQPPIPHIKNVELKLKTCFTPTPKIVTLIVLPLGSSYVMALYVMAIPSTACVADLNRHLYYHVTFLACSDNGCCGLDLHNGTLPDYGKSGQYNAHVFTDEAIRLIEKQVRPRSHFAIV